MTDTMLLARLAQRLEHLEAMLDVPVVSPHTPTQPVLPAAVAPGELIESAWGNQVVGVLELISIARGGITPGGTIPAGGQLQVASITVPAGVNLIIWQGFMSSTAPDLSVTVRLFIGGAYVTDSYYRVPLVNGVAQITGHIMGVASFDSPASTVASVNIINTGGGNVDTYADATNHRIVALSARL